MIFFIVFLLAHKVVFEPSWFRDLVLPLDWCFSSAGQMETTEPWICVLVLLVGWGVVGLVFAISGLKHGVLVSRICAVLWKVNQF